MASQQWLTSWRAISGFEIDPHYGKPAARIWKDEGLTLKLVDFTQAEPSPLFNVVICNPPYVRHHHLRNGVTQQTVLNRLKRGELEGVRVRAGSRTAWRIRLDPSAYDAQDALFV